MEKKIPLEEIIAVDRLCRRLEAAQNDRLAHPLQIGTLNDYAWRPSTASPEHRQHLGWSPGGGTPCADCVRQVDLFRQLGHPPTAVLSSADLTAEDRDVLDAHCDSCKQCAARRRMTSLADLVRRAPEKLAGIVDRMAEWINLDAPDLVHAFDAGGSPPSRPWKQTEESPFRVEVQAMQANILFVGIRGPSLAPNVKALYVALVREDLVLETRVKWTPGAVDFQAQAHFPSAAVMNKRGPVSIMVAPLPEDTHVA